MRFIILFLLTFTLNAATYNMQDVTIDKKNGYSVYKKGTTKPITGLLQNYFDDNKTTKEIIPLSHGKINGNYQSFYKSGKLRSKIDYIDSKRNGKEIVYYENGKKAYEADMKDGQKNGYVTQWYKNGQKQYKVFYKNNKVEGIVTIYKEDGSIESKNRYANGKLVEQIKPKTPDNLKLQTRSLGVYGNGKDIYYLFVSPLCPHCHEFLSEIEKYKDDATFYIYLIPLNPKNKKERKILDVIYSQSTPEKRVSALFDLVKGNLDIDQKVADIAIYKNNAEIAKAQQIQMIMNVRSVPALIDTKGFHYNVNQFMQKYKSK